MRDISRREWGDLFRGYLQNRDPVEAGPCPASDEIASFFRRKTPRRKKYRLLRHILDCRVCREEFEWRHAMELRIARLIQDVKRLENQPPTRRGIPRTASPEKPSLTRWTWPVLGSAAVLIVVLLIVPARRFSQENKPTYREAQQLQFHVIFPPVGAIVHRADLHFSWKAPLPEGSFIFELFDPALGLLWHSPAIKESEIRIPDHILQLLKEEQSYFWSISGIGGDQSIIESPLYGFRLVR